MSKSSGAAAAAGEVWPGAAAAAGEVWPGAATAASEVWPGAAAAASEVGRVHEGGEWQQLFDPFWAGCASGAIGDAFRVRPRAWRDRGGRFFADGLQVLLPFL